MRLLVNKRGLFWNNQPLFWNNQPLFWNNPALFDNTPGVFRNSPKENKISPREIKNSIGVFWSDRGRSRCPLPGKVIGWQPLSTSPSCRNPTNSDASFPTFLPSKNVKQSMVLCTLWSRKSPNKPFCCHLAATNFSFKQGVWRHLVAGWQQKLKIKFFTTKHSSCKY